MKKILLITCSVLLGSIQAMALTAKCESNLVLATAESIVQNHQEKLVNLNLKASTVVQLQQSQFDGEVLVDSIYVEIPVKKEIGSYAYSVYFEIRDGNCDSAKLAGKATTSAISYSDY